MHGNVYSTRKTVRVIPPYGEGAYDYPRNSRLSAIENVRKAVRYMLEDYAGTLHKEGKGIAWWISVPYAISIRENYGTPGSYTYAVDKVN